MKILNKIIIIFFILIFTNTIQANDNENNILFSISDEIYTTIDLNHRFKYIEIKENKTLKYDQGILDDFISVLLFDKYYNDLKIEKINYVFISEQFKDIKKSIDSNNDKNIKKIFYNLNEDEIKKNISFDYKRKLIIENELKLQSDIIFNNNLNEINNIYEINVKFLSINNNINYKIDKKISLNNIVEDLDNKKINYLLKEKILNFTEQMNSKLRISIINNSKKFYFENTNNSIYGEINRKIKDSESIKFSLVQINTEKKLTKKELTCKNITNLKDEKNEIIENKDVIYNKLNNIVKDNLIVINDYISLTNGKKNSYIILCNIYYEDKIFENINTNIKINYLAKKIEKRIIKKLIKKYSLKYL